MIDVIPEGWPFLLGAVFLAGTVRGFSGFGNAMVYLPIAAQVLNPVEALVSLAAMDILGPLPTAFRARKDTAPKELWRILLGFLVMLPIGLFVLTRMTSDTYQTVIGLSILVILGLLMSGWRYRGALTSPILFGTGSAAGILGGISGLAGPPVILMYMVSQKGPRAVRANITCFLVAVDVLLIAVLHVVYGALTWPPVLIGSMLMVPYALATLVGERLFNPAHETLYRWVAYAIIGASALSTLLV